MKTKEDFITDLKRKYNNGILITEKEWQQLLDDARKKDIIVKKIGYLKKAALTEQFLGADIDEFILLTQQNKEMFTTLLNLEEYLLFIKNGNKESVIASNEEALVVLEDIFSDINKLGEENRTYLTEEM